MSKRKRRDEDLGDGIGDDEPLDLPVIETFKPITEMTEEDVFSFTQGMRKDLAVKTHHVMMKSSFVDPEVGGMLNSVLDSMDKQIIQRKKLKLDEDVAKTDEETKRLLASVMKDPALAIGNLNKINVRTEPLDQNALKIPDNLPAPSAVPGAIEITPDEVSFDFIMEDDGK